MATTETTLATDAWTDLGTTPCTLQVRNGTIRFVIDGSAPTDLKAAHLVLGFDEKSADIGISGQHVYARCGDAPGMTARVVVAR